MCARARLFEEYSEIKTVLRFDALAAAPNFKPSWNIAPTQDVLVAIREAKRGTRRPALMRWGLIPAWAKDAKPWSRTFNARGETVETTTAFKDAWRAGRRCLVVTDGFYEWRKADRQPFAIARAVEQFTVMAGLWEMWISPAGETVHSCTILTCPANELIAPLHDRMPVILAEEDWPRWLGETPASAAELKALLRPYPARRMKLWPVARTVNNWRNDGPQLVEPITIQNP